MDHIRNRPGHAHFLTFSCYKRLHLFTDPHLCDEFVKHLDHVRNSLEFELWAYVVMLNHIHLLIFPPDHLTIERILNTLKRPFAYKALNYFNELFPEKSKILKVQIGQKIKRRFWQEGGGFDRNLTKRSTIRETIRYINNNPVRSNLVGLAEEWPWSSARYWIQEVDDPIPINANTFFDSGSYME